MRKIIISLLLLLSVGAASAEMGNGLTAFPNKPVASNFLLNDLDGNQHRLSDYRGRVVVINFWATWCPPCREEMPSMQRASELLKADNIELLAINVGEDEETVFQFTANYPVEFPLLLDIDSKVIGGWPVRGLPTTFVVDPKGRVAYQAIGGRAWDDPELLAKIRALK